MRLIDADALYETLCRHPKYGLMVMHGPNGQEGTFFGDTGNDFANMIANAAKITEFEGIPIERLKELAEAEKEERLVVLPCKVGDTVYFIAFDRCFKGKCCWLKDGKCVKEKSPEYCPQEVLETKYSLQMFLDGWRVFLTREEAEAALKGGTP